MIALPPIPNKPIKVKGPLRLSISRKKDGWWITGLTDWDSTSSDVGPYESKEEAGGAVKGLLRFVEEYDRAPPKGHLALDPKHRENRALPESRLPKEIQPTKIEGLIEL